MKPFAHLAPRALAPAALLALAAIGTRAAGTAPSSDLVAVRAGTIHLVHSGDVITGGGVLLVRNRRIVAVGKDVAVPPAARVVDYGPDAVIVPGFVAADSNYGVLRPSERTADFTLRGIDHFDPYGRYPTALQEGLTTIYVAPARNRLVAGLGAVVQLAGEPPAERVLSEVCAIQGAVSAEARSTPGYWEPPVPATADVGMGFAEPQLPRTLMGAVVALRELVGMARERVQTDAYGPEAADALRQQMQARRPWRMAASTDVEARALLAFFQEARLPLVIDATGDVSGAAEEIARANVPVIVEMPIATNRGGRDHGKERDARWPAYDVAAKLAAAGVRVAITGSPQSSSSDLHFAASVARQGGLDAKLALRAITLTPAEILGVSDRVGSLEPGKHADFVVLAGPPLELGAAVRATWVGGEVAFEAYTTGADGAEPATVIAVDELYVGDGEVLAPGELLLRGGKVVEVGRHVGRPGGATVVRGHAAMPGMIDALGHLGLEGSTKSPPTRFALSRIVEPGDRVDRRVAQRGVTTVALSPRAPNRSGAPVLAYKPASAVADRMVVDDPAALRFVWTDRNRLESGKAVRDVLQKAVEYDTKWKEYEKALAEWTPPAEAAEAGKGGEDAQKDEEKKEGEKAEGEGDAQKDEKADAKKSDKKGKKKDDEPAKPMTGAWEGRVTVPPLAAERLRLYVLETDGKVEGTLRCAALTEGLVDVRGRREEKKVTLTALGTKGAIEIAGEQKEGKLACKITLGKTSVDAELEQTSTVYEVAGRSERRKPKEEKKKPAKGEPKEPGINPDLEPLRRAMHGRAAVIVEARRGDEIVDCVDAFAQAGIRPVLYGADDAHEVAEEIRDRVAGVLLDPQVIAYDPEQGARKANRFARVAEAGIPVAFHSGAEEGAADLPMIGLYAVAQGLSPSLALRALTYDAARMLAIDDRVGRLAPGMDADVLLLDGPPMQAGSGVLRVWVDGREVR